ALLAMAYVPTPHQGYRLIFSEKDTSIAFFQLLVNVAFAALLGAIIANLRWRRRRQKIEKPRPQKPSRSSTAAVVFLVAAAVVVILAILLTFGNATRVGDGTKRIGTSLPTPEKRDEQLQTSSQYASASDFAKHAAKLREQSLLDLDPQVFAPTGSRPATEQFPWKKNIVTTVFWIGEPQSSENPKAHVKSAWDANWTANYGGVDRPDPSARRSYLPTAFIPRQN